MQLFTNDVDKAVEEYEKTTSKARHNLFNKLYAAREALMLKADNTRKAIQGLQAVESEAIGEMEHAQHLINVYSEEK